MAANLNELRAELATVEANLAHELPHAEAERCLRALDRDPGVFAGAGSRVRVLEKRAHEIEAAIIAEEADMKAREFVGSHDEYVRLGQLERELDATIERAQLELASARRDGAAAIDWKRRYDSPNGFAELGYAGWDHKTPGPGAMQVPDEIRAQLKRIDAAEQDLKTLRTRRMTEASIPRQTLAQRFPALHSLKTNVELEKTT